ncbi:tetratricopeptide repeat protein [Murinocardiopsis flavida]|nr:tetratricopeptide repeat protein [Murinocardiopsis flavida]
MSHQVARTGGGLPPDRRGSAPVIAAIGVGAAVLLTLSTVLGMLDVPSVVQILITAPSTLVGALVTVFGRPLIDVVRGWFRPSATRAPAELPIYSERFTGYVDQMAGMKARFDRFPRGGLRGMLRPRPRPGTLPARSPLVVAVTGVSGTGKTQLVTQVAHEMADRFPDGQRWVDLYDDHESEAPEEFPPHLPGPDSPARIRWPWNLGRREPDSPAPNGAATRGPAPRRTDKVLVDLLRSLGGRPRTDAPRQELIRLWRTLTHTKRLLIVLDNAKDAAQVADLLPNGPRCAVLITSRRSFSDAPFECDEYVLNGITRDEGLRLLGKLAPEWFAPGAGAVDRSTALAIVDRCHRLPLALRLCGGRLAARSGPSPTELLRELDTLARNPLLHATGGFATAFEYTLKECRRLDRLLLKRIADSGLSSVSAWSAAALLDSSVEVAQARLAELQNRFLVAAVRSGDGRYRLHDLIRDFLRRVTPDQIGLDLQERDDWSETESDAAAVRLITAYTWLAERAANAIGRVDAAFAQPETTALHPDRKFGIREPADPDAWLARERRSVLACITLAERHGNPELGWRLARALTSMCQSRRVYWVDWEESTRAQERTAHAFGDRLALGMALLDCAEFTGNQGDYEQGAEYALKAQSILGRVARPDPLWLARARRAIGVNLHRRGDLDDGLLELAGAASAFGAHGQAWWRARTLANMAEVHNHLDLHRRAQELVLEACALFEAEGDWEQYYKARVLLAEVLPERGRHLYAWFVLVDARKRFEERGDSWYVARCLRASAELDGDELTRQYNKCDAALAPTRRDRAWSWLRSRRGPVADPDPSVLSAAEQEAKELLGEYWEVRDFEFGPNPGRTRRARRYAAREEWTFVRRVQMLSEAIRIFQGMGDQWGVSRTRLVLGRVQIHSGAVDAGAQTMRAAAEGFDELRDQWWHARSHLQTARHLYNARRPLEALRHARDAEKVYRRLANHTGRIRVFTLLGRILETLEDNEGAERHWREALDAAREHGEDVRHLDAYENLRGMLGPDWDADPPDADTRVAEDGDGGDAR